MNNLTLTTKFHNPPCSKGLVSRPRLHKQLNTGLHERNKLTLVSAPAGYGKTTLIAEWIDYLQSLTNEIERPKISWLSLEDADNDIVRFLHYFLGTFQQVEESLGYEALSHLEFPTQLQIPSLLDILLNDLATMGLQFVLILDDYHVVTNPLIHQTLEYFLEHLPASVHLVLTTRADPPLPLARLRAGRQMTEIRAHDLRFSSDEARVFLNLAKITLTDNALRSLDERTEGWVAGLQLAALALENQSDPDAFIETFRGSHRYILDYLAEEVVQQLSEEMRTFLMQTCLLARFNDNLCNALTLRDDSQDVIVWLEQSNMFIIPLDDERHWYRYHHLFANFLKGHLQHNRPDDLPLLHRRAAQWYQTNNYPEDALQHAFAIPDYSLVSQLVIDNWRRVYHTGRLGTAVQWLESLPSDLLRQSPPLGVAYCWTLFIRGDYNRIDIYLDDIDLSFRQMVESRKLPIDHPEYNIISHQLILLRGIVMRHQGDVASTIKTVEQLLPSIAELREPLGQEYVDMGLTACYSQLGYAYADINDYEQADQYLSRVSLHARNCGNFFSLAHATMAYAKICLEQGQVKKAEMICRHELSLTEDPAYADLPAFCLIQLALADVMRVQKSWEEAEKLLNQGLEMARKSGHEYYLAQGYLIAARLHHALRRLGQVKDDMHEADQIAASLGNRFLNDAISKTKEALKGLTSTPENVVDLLSEQELRILNLVTEGKTNAEIADELFITVGTVKWHVHNIFQKLGVSNRPQAIALSRELGI